MKKMILGTLFFVVGFVGVLALSILSVFNPWDYNGITGLRGSLLGMGMMHTYILFFIIGVVGIIICVFEAYAKKIVTKQSCLTSSSKYDNT